MPPSVDLDDAVGLVACPADRQRSDDPRSEREGTAFRERRR
jgi:hypothetical protein